MDACRECIAYKVHHNTAEPWECPDCNQKTFIWKQNNSGTFYMECSNCGSLAAVDLNTPCEQDPIFWQRSEIVIEPQPEKYSNRVILDLAKHFHINTLQMRKRLMEGYTVEFGVDKIGEYTELFKRNGIAYRIDEPEDPRCKYLYYEKCNYLYSAMQIYLK